MKKVFNFFSIISFTGILVYIYNIALAYFKYYNPKFSFPDPYMLGGIYEFSFHFVLICIFYVFLTFVIDLIKFMLKKQKSQRMMFYRLFFVVLWLFIFFVDPGGYWSWFID